MNLIFVLWGLKMGLAAGVAAPFMESAGVEFVKNLINQVRGGINK